MRFFFTLLLIPVSFSAMGQKIEFRSDSLFINSCFVDWLTSKSKLDSLLNEKGRLKNIVGKHKTGSFEATKWLKIIYNKAGLIFSKKDNDSSNLSVAIKLYKNSNPEVDQNNMATKTFKGQFFIDSNYMNDKRTTEQLQKLKKISVSCKESTFAKRTRTVFCDIFYAKRGIKALFDFQTNSLTCIFID